MPCIITFVCIVFLSKIAYDIGRSLPRKRVVRVSGSSYGARLYELQTRSSNIEALEANTSEWTNELTERQFGKRAKTSRIYEVGCWDNVVYTCGYVKTQNQTEREGGGGGGRETETDRQRQTDRDRNREIETDIQRHKDRQTDRQTDRDTETD